ncbi:MAG: hypothetical protein EZS28_055628 [Streblomastix strix]|uniref:Uncharacterized protein n=1 Tax=Streblomastix strix TaxID=222440 RepID=A0A5J4PYK3_9EUKA|nr:MAG: hypothetical protein EZS28_055628 [Streblomastix strix]
MIEEDERQQLDKEKMLNLEQFSHRSTSELNLSESIRSRLKDDPRYSHVHLTDEQQKEKQLESKMEQIRKDNEMKETLLLQCTLYIDKWNDLQNRVESIKDKVKQKEKEKKKTEKDTKKLKDNKSQSSSDKDSQTQKEEIVLVRFKSMVIFKIKQRLLEKDMEE